MTHASPGPLTCRTERRDRTTVLLLAGDVDLDAEQTMSRALAEAVAQRPASLVVDLAGVGFLDSTGLRCLLIGKRQADASGVPFSVSGAHGSVHHVLSISGVLAALSEGSADGAAVVTAEAQPAGLRARLRRLTGR